MITIPAATIWALLVAVPWVWKEAIVNTVVCVFRKSSLLVLRQMRDVYLEGIRHAGHGDDRYHVAPRPPRRSHVHHDVRPLPMSALLATRCAL